MDIICDIDGTIADCTHRLHHIKNKPKNWFKFCIELKNDTLIKEIHDLVFALTMMNHRIILCTGREEKHRNATVQWLKEHVSFPWEKLYMRGFNDYRQDGITKLDLLKQMRLDGYNPVLAIDDRDTVCKAFRSTGLIVLQCSEDIF